MKEYAKQYYELGLNPTCISYIKTKYNVKENNPEKSPSHAWKRWQVRRPMIDEVMQLNWDVSNGIGAVLGHATKCLDIDNCNDYDFIKEFIKSLRLPEDYGWVVKSPNGFHIHLRSDTIYFASHAELVHGVLPVYPNDKYSSKFSKLELRWANHIVLPPTIINGKRYHFINDNIPTMPPERVDMYIVFSALSRFCGNYYSGHGNFEAQKMIFQLAASSDRYPFAQAAYGSIKDEIIKGATNSTGFIAFDRLPKNIKAGYVEFDSNNSSYTINNLYKGAEFFIDIETTGLVMNEFDYENYPRVIQIAYYNSYEKKLKSIYIKPDGLTLPEEIENLTGISNDFLIKNGVDIRQALFSMYIPENCQIIGHNLDFDLSVLDSEYLRYNKKNPERYIRPTHRNGSQTFCTMKKFASIFNVKYPKLSEMYYYFFDDLPPHRMHDASNDIKVLIDCYYIMCLLGYIKVDYENRIIL